MESKVRNRIPLTRTRAEPGKLIGFRVEAASSGVIGSSRTIVGGKP
jgi:hypothetical protein